MSSASGAKCKLCRREGMKLMLKGERCYLDKCAIENRNYPPGQHGANARRKKLVGGSYAEQLREKQKIKRIYGLRERQFSNFFTRAVRIKGVTGEVFLQLLERRLDNIVYRMGFAPSRESARQLVRHSHFLVNGKKVNIPSYIVSAGDVISVAEKSTKTDIIHTALKSSRRGGALDWISVDKVKLSGSVVTLPSRDQIPTPVNEQLVVELYSK
jgi:small subunit ribosomal protein S4